ncbi:FMN-dependent NADH-azoreductase [Vibrio sp. SM6]|uniref:FMN dependent NADH:quinone oxidoreductase n=1 Tax=Vibrio agarilyticus TaxID=2726741 RepID=A0A7X8YGF2_9VIBR|nr:NAD(P)H-dependent oxidoreductase [Vibrio agarilyticus]NLS12893.1 FMN-dependent NADH-azoreductase [Vibrio agarilyticus]
MKNILVINSSVRTESSHSRRLTQSLVSRMLQQYQSASVVHRDVAQDCLPHYDSHSFIGCMGGTTPEQQAASERSLALIEEVKRADTLVIGIPVYNFSIPSTLKSWIDHIARAGVTFRYTEEGPQGELGGRKVYLVITCGGGTTEYVEGQMRASLSMLGMDDVTIVKGIGLDMVDSTSTLTAVDAAIECCAI